MSGDELSPGELEAVSGGKKKKPVGTSRGFCMNCNWVDIPNDKVYGWELGYPIGPCPKCGESTVVVPTM